MRKSSRNPRPSLFGSVPEPPHRVVDDPPLEQHDDADEQQGGADVDEYPGQVVRATGRRGDEPPDDDGHEARCDASEEPAPADAEARWSYFRGGHFGRFGSHQSRFGPGFPRVKRWRRQSAVINIKVDWRRSRCSPRRREVVGSDLVNVFLELLFNLHKDLRAIDGFS
jgi:hypothetical protein